MDAVFRHGVRRDLDGRPSRNAVRHANPPAAVLGWHVRYALSDQGHACGGRRAAQRLCASPIARPTEFVAILDSAAGRHGFIDGVRCLEAVDGVVAHGEAVGDAITFGERVYHVLLGLAPDGRVSHFSLRAEK